MVVFAYSGYLNCLQVPAAAVLVLFPAAAWTWIVASDLGLYSMKNYDSLDKKILFMTSLETKQRRYREQVHTPFVGIDERDALVQRLKSRLSKNEDVQVEAKIIFCDVGGNVAFSALGLADVVKGDTVYELKFV